MSAPELNKRLGQHHLVDGRICRPLIEFLQPRDRSVVEIGPGGGILTAELIAAGARVIAIELDKGWAFELRRRLLTGAASPKIVIADALEVDWNRLGGGTFGDARPAATTQIAGNLPYNIATALIERLLPHHRRISRMAFLIQKEVAQRLSARCGDKGYGALSVLVAARAKVRILGKVKPGSFRPPPKVDSAFVGLSLEPPALPESEMAAFTQTVRQAFAQRRKTLRNSLAAAWSKSRAEAVLDLAAIEPRLRAENLGLDDFLRLHRASRRASSGFAAPAPR